MTAQNCQCQDSTDDNDYYKDNGLLSFLSFLSFLSAVRWKLAVSEMMVLLC